MQIYIISNQIDISYIGGCFVFFKLSKQGEVFSLMVRWKQTHWNMSAHRMTNKSHSFQSRFLIIVCYDVLFVFSFYYLYDKTTLHLFYIDSAESKKTKNIKNTTRNCAFLEIRTENGVLPEQRFVGLHTLSVMLGVRKHCQEQV